MINPKYTETIIRKIIQPEITKVIRKDGKIYVEYIGTGGDCFLPTDPPVVGPQKEIEITEQVIKPEFSHLALSDLLY